MTTPRVMVNGEQRPVVDIEPHVTALDWLRDQGLIGAKKAVQRASAAPARCWWPGPTATIAPAGPR